MVDWKQGQSANRVGTMIILITVVLILYLLFLPPDTRDQILYNESDPGETVGENGDEVIERLLDTTVGDLEYVDRNRRRHSVPAYTVSARLEGTELQSRETMSVSRSLFNERIGRMRFTTTPSLTQDVRLSFNVESGQGDLTVRLNDEVLYTDETTAGSVPPIRIDADQLRSENTLTFTVESPGIAFWSANEYRLENVRVTADVRDESQNRNYQSVFIPQDDYNRIERVEAEYIATCQEDDVEGFQMVINDFLLFEGTPDCALTTKKEFDADVLQPGQNDLVTQVEEGRVLVDRFTLTTYFGETEEKTYYFELDDTYFPADNRTVLDSDYEVNATFVFADDDEKQFNYFVNGRRESVTTREARLTESVSEKVIQGTNSFRIEPRSDFTMSRLHVDLIEQN
jgi:hypothetical protein